LLFSPFTRIPTNGCTSTFANRSKCCLQTLSPDETAKFLQVCKKQGLTVTTMCAAAFSKSIADELVRLGVSNAPKLQLCFVVDTRGVCVPPVSPNDMSIHAASLPPCMTPTENLSVFDLARNFRSFIVQHLPRLLDYAHLLADRLSGLQPAHVFCPSLVVSSWSAKPPILPKYQTSAVVGAELFQNVAHTGWLALSVYSPVKDGPLCLSLFAAVPRFDPELVERISQGGIENIKRTLRE